MKSSFMKYIIYIHIFLSQSYQLTNVLPLSFFLSSFFFLADEVDSNPDTSALLTPASSSLRPTDFLLLSEIPKVGGGPAKKSEKEQSFRPFFLIADSLKYIKCLFDEVHSYRTYYSKQSEKCKIMFNIALTFFLKTHDSTPYFLFKTPCSKSYRIHCAGIQKSQIENKGFFFILHIITRKWKIYLSPQNLWPMVNIYIL